MRALLIGSILLSTFALGQSQSSLNLMPLPNSVQAGTGQLVIDSSFSVGITGSLDPGVNRALQIFLRDLRHRLAFPPQVMKVVDASQAKLVVHAERSTNSVQELGEDESYALQITATGASLNAPTPLGIMRGLQTFLQLLQTTTDGFAVPAVTIHDSPRFPWRGLMIDVCRHFMPLDVLKRNLDGMAAVKLNVFHWHLSDNQGFRVESKKFPKLQEMGSDGLFYTQDEVRELIAYAGDRGIRVVPEFDMPGHSTAWFVGYPELASAPGPYQIERKWGVFDPAMDPTEESTYEFLDKLIGEMVALFPDRYFHIGGDEVNGKQWDANPKIQSFMHAHGLKNNADLQAYFNQRAQKIVAMHGKIMVGWDEVLRPDLPKDIVVQSWRGQASLADASRQGFRGLLSFGYYLDLMWPASRHYAVDPLADAAAKLTPEEQQRILGGEACMWSEYVSPENIDSRIWPRMAVIAERLWSRQEVTNVDSMYQRMAAISEWLDWLGLTHNTSYEPMLRRIAGSDNTAPLRTLADVVEPVKDYTREEIAVVEATSLMPLDRLVDTVRPESQKARLFAEAVDALSQSGGTDAGKKLMIKTWLAAWQSSQSALLPLEQQSFLLKEVMPLSETLSQVAAIGLRALDFLDRAEKPPADWQNNQLVFLQQAEQPKAQLLLMIVPPVEKLVEMAAGAQK